MTVTLIVRKSLRQHALSTAITALSIALGVGLWMAVWVVKEQSQATFAGANLGFDAVLGARGSKLQLVLNAVFHLEASPGNLQWDDVLQVQKAAGVEAAVPLAVGDNFRGWRLVGTTPDFFQHAEPAPGQRFTVRAGGRPFEAGRQEALVGSVAAQRLGLKPGDTFHPSHGLAHDESAQHEEEYVVVGVLEPSNTPADRVIWIPLEGIQHMGGHDPQSASEVSAVLVKLLTPVAGFRMDTLYNKQGNRLTFAWPISQIVAQLFDKLAWLNRVLELVAYLVAVVAAGSVLASLYNSMNERRREIAILRALGARRLTVSGVIVLESTVITALGVAAGFLVYGAILTVVASIVRAQTGVMLNPLAGSGVMIWAPAIMLGLGALMGVIPALKAYRTPVAENLVPGV